MIGVPDLSDGCVSVLVDLPDFTGGHPHQCVTGFTVIEYRLLARAPRDLAASARDKL
jgi:hypothetical protein